MLQVHPNAPVEIQISEDNRQAQFDFQKCAPQHGLVLVLTPMWQCVSY